MRYSRVYVYVRAGGRACVRDSYAYPSCGLTNLRYAGNNSGRDCRDG